MSALPSHLELVQGVVLPKPVGADPVLDFLNTRSDWTDRGPARTEWLTSFETLVIWTGYVGLLSDATRLIEQAAGRPDRRGPADRGGAGASSEPTCTTY